MVYFIILQRISQASRQNFRPAAETIAAGNRGASQPVWPVQFDNMGTERKKAALPGASQLIAVVLEIFEKPLCWIFLLSELGPVLEFPS